MIRVVFILSFLIVLINTSYSQFEIGAELRSRFEYRDGYSTLKDTGQVPAFIVAQRTRLNTQLVEDKLTLYLAIQDIRIWGEQKTKDDIASLALYQGWGLYNFNKSLGLKLGRQEFIYDDQRLLSNTNWNNVATTHDALLFTYEPKNFKIHLAGAYNNDKEKNYESNYPVVFYKTMNFLWFNHKVNKSIKYSFLYLIDGFQKSDSYKKILFRNTAGLNIYVNLKEKLFFHATGFKQFGKDVNEKSVDAFLYSVDIAYKFKKGRITAGYDFYSGNNKLDTADKKVRVFSNLYGSGHGFLGSMDYFTSIDKHTKDGGINDLYGKFKYSLDKEKSLEISYHLFNISGAILDPKIKTQLTAMDKRIGQEVDFTGDFNISKSFNLKLGYSMIFTERTMHVIKGGIYDKTSLWAWAMITYKINKSGTSLILK